MIFLRYLISKSPNSCSFAHRAIGFVCGLYVESFVPGIHIAWRNIATQFTWRMRIGFKAGSQFLGACISTPNLCPAKEKTLVGSKPIYFFVTLALFCLFKRFVGNIETTE